jgi:hypothetical protein
MPFILKTAYTKLYMCSEQYIFAVASKKSPGQGIKWLSATHCGAAKDVKTL